MKQNSSTELSAHSFLGIYNKNGSPDPPDPNLEFSGFFPHFLLDNFLVGNMEGENWKAESATTSEILGEWLSNRMVTMK